MFEEKNPLRAEELFVITSGQGKEKFAFADSNNDQALDLTEFFVFRYPRDSSREEVCVTNLFWAIHVRSHVRAASRNGFASKCSIYLSARRRRRSQQMSITT